MMTKSDADGQKTRRYRISKKEADTADLRDGALL